MIILCIILVLAPIAIYIGYEFKQATPSQRWPELAAVLKLGYEDDPARITGDWCGRRTQIVNLQSSVTLTAWLKTPTRLRVECGPTALVTQRAGLVVPDPVEPLDRMFGEKLLARCSEKAAGPIVFDAGIQIRLSDIPRVDLVGSDVHVIWTLPDLKDLEEAEAILGTLCAIADGLERFPATAGRSRA